MYICDVVHYGRNVLYISSAVTPESYFWNKVFCIHWQHLNINFKLMFSRYLQCKVSKYLFDLTTVLHIDYTLLLLQRRVNLRV